MKKKKQKVAIGIDLGGTKIAAGLVSRQGQLIVYHRVPSLTAQVKNPGDLVRKIVELVQALKAEAVKGGYEVQGLGLACAGPVNVERGELVEPTNMKLFKIVPICDLLLKALKKNRIGLDLYFQNDAVAAALGEYTFGSAQAANVSVMITVGTGIGTGVLYHGQPLQNRGIGSEWGISLLGEKSYEELSAGPALIGRATTFAKKQVVQLTDFPAQVLKSSAFKKAVFQPTVDALAKLCFNLSLGLAPDVITFSGGAFSTADYFFEDLEARYEKLIKPVEMFRSRLTRSELNHVGVWGAAALVFKNVSPYPAKRTRVSAKRSP